MGRNQIFAFVCLCGLASPSTAITLNNFVADVIQSNPQVLQRVHSYRQVVEDGHIAAKGWRPSVDLTASTGVYTTNSPLTGLQDNDYGSYNAALTVSQNLFNGYDTTHAKTEARARIRSELYRIYDDADNIAIEATGFYIDALKQRQLLELAKRNITSQEHILRKIHGRNISGVGRRSDEEQVQGRLAQARAGLLAQQNNLQDALTRLHYILGRYVAADELENPGIPVLPQEELELLLDRAIDNHPAMKSAAYNIEASESAFKRTKNKFYPQIDLQLKKLIGDDISGYDGATDEHSAAINLSYNLYNGGADRARQQQQLSAVYEHREYAVKVRRQIIEGLRLAWVAGKALDGQQGYLNEYVDKSKNTLGYYREEFFVGQRDLMDLLDAEGELNAAMVSHTNAKHDALIAVFQVYEGMGELFKALSLAVELSDDSLQLITLKAKGIDTLPFDPDIDEDNELDVTDHCDNSLPKRAVDTYGCNGRLELGLGFVRVEQLNFIFDSAELTDEAHTRLNQVIIDIEKVASGATIEVHAHTDSTGGDNYNQRLSQRRADRIKRILVDASFDSQNIKAIGRGEYEPIADNKTDEGKAQNRRVEFHVLPLEVE